MPQNPSPSTPIPQELTSREVAQWLGVTVRTVQLMVDRGDLQAWKTPGGHRRIARASVEAWRATPSPRHFAFQKARDAQKLGKLDAPQPTPAAHKRAAACAPTMDAAPPTTVVLIEPTRAHHRRLRNAIAQAYQGVHVHVATEGVTGLALCATLRPQLLVLNADLPGLDSIALLRGLAHHPQLRHMPVVLLTPNGWQPNQTPELPALTQLVPMPLADFAHAQLSALRLSQPDAAL